MKLSFIILSLVSGLALSAPPHELSFYVVSPVEGKAPVVDGCLNEAAWEKAAVFRHYYVYHQFRGASGKIAEDHYRL